MSVPEQNVVIQRNVIIIVVADDPLTGTEVAVCLAAITTSIYVIISWASHTYSDTFSRCPMRMIQKFYPLWTSPTL
jgi:hypothetical protein